MPSHTTLDSTSLCDALDPEHHPCLLKAMTKMVWKSNSRMKKTTNIYMEMALEDKKVLKGNDSADYFSEG